VQQDPMLGRKVEVRSGAGMRYYGVVRSIRAADGLGELFELGASDDAAYQRLVYVADRSAQIRELDATA
jgi:hypothetical protein